MIQRKDRRNETNKLEKRNVSLLLLLVSREGERSCVVRIRLGWRERREREEKE